MLARGLLAFTLCILFALEASAQLNVSRLWAERPKVAQYLASRNRSRLLLAPRNSELAGPAVLPLNSRFSLVAAEPGEFWPELHWSPPRRLLLDRARTWIDHNAAVALLRENGTEATGAGVAVGIVDSGVDPRHPALQNPDGSTRIAWFIDFQTPAYGLHPELEDELGCTSELTTCAILSRADINRLLQGGRLESNSEPPVRLPRDPLGHGTHVASLAAGSGEANSVYSGVASAAELIIANVSGSSLAVEDADVLLATHFIYRQASEAGWPAVVNLSLGGDFGPHDGSSALARALEGFLDVPGRALVVSAGNSGTLIERAPPPYPSPLGIHTDVHVVTGHETRVPLLLPSDAQENTGAVFVYIGSREMDRLSVGLELADGTSLVLPQAPGEVAMADNSRLQAAVINRRADDSGALIDTQHGAAVVLSGSFQQGEVVAITLTGRGNAQLWVQSEGPFTFSTYGGALFPAATSASTITIPAAAEGLIAVGATWNRQQWPTLEGSSELSYSGSDVVPGRVAFFSSRGPNLLGALKPDILAPGAAIVGAMARDAAPVNTRGGLPHSSMFGVTPWCSGIQCAVVDDTHAVALGTSMAAPLVTGAVALLLQRQPDLTQAQVQALLQAGAGQLHHSSVPHFATAPGSLNVYRSLQALELMRENGAQGSPSPRHSWVGLSAALAHPDPEWEVRGLLHLRDANGAPIDVSPSRLQLRVTSGSITQPLSRSAPSLYSFRVAAEPAKAQVLRLRVLHENVALAEEELTIAVDSHVAQRGFSLRGGCQHAHSSPLGGSVLALAGLLLAQRRWRRNPSA